MGREPETRGCFEDLRSTFPRSPIAIFAPEVLPEVPAFKPPDFLPTVRPKLKLSREFDHCKWQVFTSVPWLYQ